MTTGAPIYLVSACSSGEEFVAAFRRYADRNGVLFVPIAEPLPPGKRGRFAITLTGGGVMIEGEAEVVSSAKTPSVLYGRVGMTLKFTEPDEPSKTLLGELERARLAVKPGPPSVPPRPAELPAAPRPTPPTPAGRIDAVNALAQCVVIGDVSTLVGDEPKSVASKFVVPSIPPMGAGARPRSPSTPPSGTPSATATTMGMPPLKKVPTGGAPVVPAPPAPSATATTMGMAPLAKAPAPPADLKNLDETVKGPAPAVDLLVKEREERRAREQVKADPETTMRGPAPTPAKPPTPAVGVPRPPTPAVGVPRPPTPASGSAVVPTRTTTPPAGSNVVGAELPKSPSGPVANPFAVKQPTPPAGVPKPPVVAEARPLVEELADDEPTDLTSVPLEPSGPITGPREVAKPEKSVREQRRTSIGVAVVPSGVHVLPATAPRAPTGDAEARDTGLMAAEETSGPAVITSAPPPRSELEAAGPPSGPVTVPQKVPSAVLRAAAVEEHTPSGDWTMTVGADGPTITPVPRKATGTRPPGDKPAKPIPPGPPTGDFIIALDPTRPDGWSEPSKIEKRPELPADKPGPPVSAVASVKDLDSDAKPETRVPAVKADEAKIEIDPTLMEPLQPLQPIDDFDDEPPGQLPPPPTTAPPVQTSPHGLVAATPGVIATPVPMQPGAVPITDVMRAGALAMPGEPTAATNPAMHGGYPAPLPGQLANASSQVPAYPQAYPVADQAYMPTEAIRVPRSPDERKRRMMLIGGIAGGAILLGIILVVALSGGGDKQADATEPAPAGDGSAGKQVSQPPPVEPKPTAPPAPPSGDGSAGSAQQAAVAPVVPVDAAAEEPPERKPPDEPPQVAAATDCNVAIASAPTGAEVLLDRTVLGTTPMTAALPCGVESKLTFKKTRYVSATRTVTPKPEGGKPVRVALARVTFTVKVSSSPAGATILLGARSLGVTPAAVKLPAFETSTLTIKKDGYQPDTQRVTPKTNNLSITSSLKKAPARRGR
ncbi:MAG: PEGA domain-containing protein [Myxococcales bacterium]|nr:PEGA domain-containing protein [Myxococcales bacterium]